VTALLSHGMQVHSLVGQLHSHEAQAPERFAACPPAATRPPPLPPQNAQAPTLLGGLGEGGRGRSASASVGASGSALESGARWDGLSATIAGRVNVSPKRLVEPGPSDAQLHGLLQLAAAAPDHGQLMPWRFVLVPQAQRPRLGEAFVQALIARDPSATVEQIDSAREKALRAPLLLLAVACHGRSEARIPVCEQLVSLGAAVQNVLLGAQALGFGSGLTSGQAMDSEPLRALFGLQAHEAAVCFVNIGTVGKHKASNRVRPAPEEFLCVLGG